jgi:hypothetical protein
MGHARIFWNYCVFLALWKYLRLNHSMYDTIYYDGFKSRVDDLIRRELNSKVNPLPQEFSNVYEVAFQDRRREELLQSELDDRRNRVCTYAERLGFYGSNVVVEAYQDTLPVDSQLIRRIGARIPTVVVMDSLSIFLQQLNMSYWITLLRTALQNDVLPITVHEYNDHQGVIKDFDVLCQARLAAIESLTEHIRPEPKREQGRRKLGPIADLVEEILVLTALGQFTSSTSVIQFISEWYKEKTKNPDDHTLRDRIFDEVRWHTYKYKVRTMVKVMLEKEAKRDYEHDRLPNDIWQPSISSVVSVASIAAAKVLPEYGYIRTESGWVKG